MKGVNDYVDIVGVDVCIVIVGVLCKLGMLCDDLLGINLKVMKLVGEGIKVYVFDVFVICIINLLDVMVWVLCEFSGLLYEKVVGMVGVLDLVWFCYFLLLEFGVLMCDVMVFVLGGYGDIMVLLICYFIVVGILLFDLVKMGWILQEKLDSIVQCICDGGVEIVGLLKIGLVFYVLVILVIEMVEVYLKDQKCVLFCVVYVDGVYGLNGFYVGVLIVIGVNGIEKVIDIMLNVDEQVMFDKLVDLVKGLVEVCKGIDGLLV